MAYVQPTPLAVKNRLPEFIAVPDSLINLLLNEAFDFIGETWLERDRAKAQIYYVGHLLALEGEPDRSNSASNGGGGGGGNSVKGHITSEKVGDVQVNYAGPSSSTSAGSGSGSLVSALGSTMYGRMLLMLMRLNFPAIGVV